jgi:hypothetical protein
MNAITTWPAAEAERSLSTGGAHRLSLPSNPAHPALAAIAAAARLESTPAQNEQRPRSARRALAIV